MAVGLPSCSSSSGSTVVRNTVEVSTRSMFTTSSDAVGMSYVEVEVIFPGGIRRMVRVWEPGFFLQPQRGPAVAVEREQRKR